MTIKKLQKELVEAIRKHTMSSANDLTDQQSLNTLMCAMFNLLGCAPYSILTNTKIVEHMYTDLKTPERMKDLNTINAMVEAYLALVKASQPFEDVLASISMEFGHKELGQFFTSNAMAGGVVKFVNGIQKSANLSISDPTGCGTGSLLLAYLRRMHREDPSEISKVTGVDIDPNMVRTCAVQVMWSALLHHISLELVLWNCNVITDYNTASPVAVFSLEKECKQAA